MDCTADLAMLTSPNRVAHRRVRSDPSEFIRSLRTDRFAEDGSIGMGEEPMATGEVAFHEPPSEAEEHRSRPPSSTSSDPEDEPSDAEARYARRRCSPNRRPQPSASFGPREHAREQSVRPLPCRVRPWSRRPSLHPASPVRPVSFR